MERREFIKKSMYVAGCLSIMGCGAGYLFGCRNENENDEFYIKSDDELPTSIRPDFASVCQLNCPECWRNRMTPEELEKVTIGYISFETFKSFMEKSKFIKTVLLNASGELFLNPDIDKILEYCHSHNIETVSTGGVNLNDVSDETLENLVKFGVKWLRISIDGACQETYSIYRVNGNYDKVIDNIKKINAFKKKYNSEFPVLEWQFIPFGHNEHEIEKVKEISKGLDMKIKFVPNYSPEYSPLKNPEKVMRQTGIKLNSYEEMYEEYKKNHNIFFFCNEMKIHPIISVDGDLMPCCIYVLKKNLGINAFKRGLRDAMNDKKILQIKHTLADFGYKDPSPYCSDCDFYEFLKKVDEKIFP